MDNKINITNNLLHLRLNLYYKKKIGLTDQQKKKQKKEIKRIVEKCMTTQGNIYAEVI